MTESLVTIPDTVTTIKPNTAPRRSSRLHLEPEWFQNEVFIMEDDEPANYNEAMVSPTSIEWQKAMESEIESMHQNQVLRLVDPPEGVKPIECKWIFKTKDRRRQKLDRLQSSACRKRFLTSPRG